MLSQHAAIRQKPTIREETAATSRMQLTRCRRLQSVALYNGQGGNRTPDAGICGVGSDWLAGFGPDRGVVELVAYRLAGGFWDEDGQIRSLPRGRGDIPDVVRRADDLMRRLEVNRAERAQV